MPGPKRKKSKGSEFNVKLLDLSIKTTCAIKTTWQSPLGGLNRQVPLYYGSQTQPYELDQLCGTICQLSDGVSH